MIGLKRKLCICVCVAAIAGLCSCGSSGSSSSGFTDSLIKQQEEVDQALEETKS